MSIKDFIRSRTQEEWKSYFLGYAEHARAYIQAHGERSALIGFALGIFMVLFTKLFLVLVAIGVIVCLGIYLNAPS
jgi:hypothetical protein